LNATVRPVSGSPGLCSPANPHIPAPLPAIAPVVA
jgi:hypothetical protein